MEVESRLEGLQLVFRGQRWSSRMTSAKSSTIHIHVQLPLNINNLNGTRAAFSWTGPTVSPTLRIAL